MRSCHSNTGPSDGGSDVDDNISDANVDDGFGASDNIEYHNKEDSDTDPSIENNNNNNNNNI